jgi:hypothetical protein
VREDESLYVLAGNLSSQARNTASPIFKYLAILSLFLAVLSAFAFVGLYIKQIRSIASASAHREHIDVE